MAYDEEIAHRIRAVLAGDEAVVEKRMFGGLAFVIGGNMAVTASGRGGLMVRVDPDEGNGLLSPPDITLMTMAGRDRRGWLHVTGSTLHSDEEFAAWVLRGAAYARTLRPK